MLNLSTVDGSVWCKTKICHNWMADGFAASGRHANITLKSTIKLQHIITYLLNLKYVISVS
jgi:hypothetical protein